MSHPASDHPRRPGPAPSLSVPTITAAAVGLADARGLDAVTMREVAGALSTSAAGLYRYVASRDELLAHMVDAAFGAAPDEPAADESWRAGLTRWADAHLAVLRRHRWLLRVPISGPPLMPNQVLWFERGLQCLRATPLPEPEKPAVLLLVNGFVRNEATLEADLLQAAQASGVTLEHAGAAYGRLLGRLTTPDRFPAIHAVLAARAFDPPGTTADDVGFGLERILDGIETLIRARGGSTHA